MNTPSRTPVRATIAAPFRNLNGTLALDEPSGAGLDAPGSHVLHQIETQADTRSAHRQHARPTGPARPGDSASPDSAAAISSPGIRPAHS